MAVRRLCLHEFATATNSDGCRHVNPNLACRELLSDRHDGDRELNLRHSTSAIRIPGCKAGRSQICESRYQHTPPNSTSNNTSAVTVAYSHLGSQIAGPELFSRSSVVFCHCVSYDGLPRCADFFASHNPCHSYCCRDLLSPRWVGNRWAETLQSLSTRQRMLRSWRRMHDERLLQSRK